MAKEAERKAKLAKEKGPKRVATIDLSEKWLNWTIVALIAFQVFLNISAYNAALTGMNNLSLFFVGLILIVFAAFFHVYRYSLNQAKKAPPPPPSITTEERPKELAQAQQEETPELPDAKPAEDEQSKEKVSQEAPTPQVKADLGFDPNKDLNLGSSDISKP